MVANNPNSLTVASPISRLSNIPTDKAPKFIRSKDRCHIIVRTPIYDAKGSLLAYNFRYTAGEGSFRPDELQRKHVKHVLIGFYIRRHIDQFTQENAMAMTELPLSPEITKFSKPIPANRFILHLQDRQDSSASYQHQVNMLKRDTMTIAADAYTIVYTNWYDNGGLPSILVNYLKTHELNIFDYLDKNKSLKVTDDDFKNPTSLTTIDQNVLMCQTGYLTLRSSLNDSNIIALGIPNGEIYKALNKLLAAKFFKGTIDVTNDANENILDVGSVEDIISLLNTMVNTVTYDAYPLNSESSVQNYVKAYLLGAKQNVFSEIHQAKGRADLVIETNKRRIVIEFKYAKDETEAKTKLNEAIEQIKTRDYGNIVPRKDELLRIATVFNADPKVRAFTQYKFVQ